MNDIDIIFHLASSTVPSTSNLDPLLDVNANLVASLNILNMAVKAKIKKIIYFSSGGAVYGSQNGLINENHDLKPISSYGIIKSTIEKYFTLYSELYDINTIILRPSNPYGPRQGNFNTQGVISTFLKNIFNKENLTVFGNGEALKDYIYIDDLAFLSYEVAIKEKSGIFNIGTGVGTSVNELIIIISETTNVSPNVNYIESKNYDVPNFILDINKVKNIINDFNYTSLHIGIKSTWSWINQISNK